jgi:hypothetical protein
MLARRADMGSRSQCPLIGAGASENGSLGLRVTTSTGPSSRRDCGAA